jgi:hypothetical protein
MRLGVALNYDYISARLLGLEGTDVVLFLLTVSRVLGAVLALEVVGCGVIGARRIGQCTRAWRGVPHLVVGLLFGSSYTICYGLPSVLLVFWYTQNQRSRRSHKSSAPPLSFPSRHIVQVHRTFLGQL